MANKEIPPSRSHSKFWEESIKRAHAAVRTHGASHTRLYAVWKAMIRRCYNPNVDRYPRYGGRGIGVCLEWRDNAAAFLKWAIDNGYQRGLQIDRIDNDGDYTPLNCRWVLPVTQQSNTGRSRMLTYNSKTMTISEWARFLGVNRSLLQNRLGWGWSIEETLSTPPLSHWRLRKK